MLINKLLFSLFFEADKGAGSGGSGDKPAGDPPGSGSPVSTDWRDARIHELNTESATRRRENKALQDQVQQLTGQVAQMQAAMQERERTAQETMLRSNVIAAAASAGFHDPADAWNMLDKTAVKLGEGGAVEGLEAALKKISDSKPYLLKVGGATPPPTGGKTDATPPAKPPSPGNPGKAEKLTLDAIKKMEPQEIAKRLMSDPNFAKEVEAAQRNT